MASPHSDSQSITIPNCIKAMNTQDTLPFIGPWRVVFITPLFLWENCWVAAFSCFIFFYGAQPMIKLTAESYCAPFLKKNPKQMLQQPGSIHILLNSRLIFNCAISPFWIYKFIILLLYFVNPLFSRKNLLRLKSNIQLCLFTTYKRIRSK